MKKLLIIFISLNLFAVEDTRNFDAEKTLVETEESLALIDDSNTAKVIVENLDASNPNQRFISRDENRSIEDNNETDIYSPKDSADINVSVQKSSQRELSDFEKQFVNHIAYNHYKKAIELLYKKEHKSAYEEASKAKEFFDNEMENENIVLPYIPGFIRESAQTPKRIYYKILIEKDYELKRLIRKIKLLNPPIPLIVLNQTSTYIDVIIKNVGDLPLDNFLVEVNFEEAARFEKINPNESKTYRYSNSVKIEDLSFKEDYGFAPSAIELSNE